MVEDLTLTKKGTLRKRKPKQPRRYFTQDTEDAILEYLSYKPEEQTKRDRIYSKRIEYAFDKLAENIIHTFKFYYTDLDTIAELKHEIVAFLLEKLPLYNQEKGAAFSYFGTIVKRYLINYNEKNYKRIQEKANVEETDEDRIVYLDLENEHQAQYEPNTFMDEYVLYMDKYLYKIFPKNQDSKVADSILELFRKREVLEIFNKKALYIYIREITDASTPQVTKIIKRLKIIYVKLFIEYEREGCIKI
jgi:hypothetical protein